MNLLRTLGALLAAALAFGVLAVLPTAGPSLFADPGAVMSWWDDHGTAAASMGLLHLAALAAAAYVVAVLALVALAQAVRLPRAAIGLARLAPRSLRRYVTAGLMAGTLAIPSMAAAQEPIVVVDVGAESPVSSPIVVTDLGPAPPTAPTEDETAEPIDATMSSTPDVVDMPAPSPPPTPSMVPDAWLVEDGDNLWTIAETMVADHHDGSTDQSAVARYWHRLIDANQAALDDPDLIYPGQVLTLPPMVTAGS